MLVRWEDGVEEGPHGCRLREIPGGDWDDQTWISMDGRTFERTFDPLSQSWSWSAERHVHIDDDSALQVDVYSGSKRRRTRLARAIALAWIHCAIKGSHAFARHTVEARTISWQCAGTLSDFATSPNEDWVEPSPPEADLWVPMLHTWVNANGDIVERVNPERVEYMVHPQGWVRSLLSQSATQGHMTPDGKRWVAIHGKGLACVERVVEMSCHRLIPVPTPAPLSQSAARTLAALNDRKTFLTIQNEERIFASTLWSRLLMLARAAPWDGAKTLWSLCPREVRISLRNRDLNEEEGVARLLASVKDAVGEACPMQHATDNDAYGMLRIGWALIRRERLRERMA